jgi:hypothetical protein
MSFVPSLNHVSFQGGLIAGEGYVKKFYSPSEKQPELFTKFETNWVHIHVTGSARLV